MYHLNDYLYHLPPNLIANYPLPSRSDSRLLCLTQTEMTHKHFPAILDLIQPGDLLVLNDTKVIPARLYGRKGTGGRVEVLVERVLTDKKMLAQLHVSKSPRVGDTLFFDNEITLLVTGRSDRFYELTLVADGSLFDLLEQIGNIPLPLYIRRPVEALDKERYQTIYAKQKGSVAAPTAGLHFTQDLLAQLRTRGVQLGYLTLHIGAGTFLPVRTDDIKTHTMHSECLTVSEHLCEQINATHAQGKRVIAVGTTTMRALEAASSAGTIAPLTGETNLFIYPGYQFKCVDILLTNLHLPGSSLLMLICAFAGYEKVMQAYQAAVTNEYRFYSYGDAMWLECAK